MIISLAKAFTGAYMFLLTRFRVLGRENTPRNGPLIILANHLSLLDPPIMAISINRRVAFLAKEELFRNRLVGALLRALGAFPIRRGRIDLAALRQAEQVLNEGKSLVIFPEGRRSRELQLQTGFSGAVVLASRCHVPILPVGIAGTDRMRGIGWWLKRPKVTVKIGHAYNLQTSGRISREERVALTGEAMMRIAELLPVEYRGNYYQGLEHRED